MQKVEFFLKRSHGERCTPSSHPARRNRISGTRRLLVASSAGHRPLLPGLPRRLPVHPGSYVMCSSAQKPLGAPALI